ncbi:MAG: ATP-binding cassette domain-containing protein [Solirubrobacterales bacterium]|nr:ATP-binding cassette domain-containing protein [Solirubrobacterales bacterium]
MTLLELAHVAKRHRHGTRQVVDVLRDVSLELDRGELVVVWGLRRSGRSTLLRIAAGIEAPDTGAVRLGGRDLRGAGTIASGIGYCRPELIAEGPGPVLDGLMRAQLALGVRRAHARARAWDALERVGARHCAEHRAHELDRAEAVRVCIARGLVQRPAVLLIDDPTTGVEITRRDGILELLRSLPGDGTAILACVDNGTGLVGADRALSLSHGELRGLLSPEYAPVVELPVRASG